MEDSNKKLLNLISYWGGKEQLEKAVDDWVDRGRTFFSQERNYEATFNNRCIQLLNLSSEDLIFVKDNNLIKSLVGVCCSFELWR